MRGRLAPRRDGRASRVGRGPGRLPGLGAALRRCGRRCLRRDRLFGDLGQTTTEWLMIAGLLTAVAVVLLGIVPPGLRFYAQSLITSVRTIAP
jgi:hypothetical protein